ncbi:putative disease resistance protein RGA1 isoform X2 [Spinacia oleracea]|uniref:Disease resistance protein RGA1 isoform X2 n=1 Tax=Spinacia oleracea TaxID=3562 RepID=A0A9R0IM61_SPIOL|nr:putative disease resistance protein RGA1 isoform X2 [Spinacia oleracea]
MQFLRRMICWTSLSLLLSRSSFSRLVVVSLKKEEETDGGIEDGGITRLMEELQPHSNLNRLEVNGYHGKKLLGWQTFPPNLVKLCLIGCGELEFLPWLGNLYVLKVLQLKDLGKLEYIEEDSPPVLGNTEKLSFLSSLEELRLEDMWKLKGWRRGIIFINSFMIAATSTTRHICNYYHVFLN